MEEVQHYYIAVGEKHYFYTLRYYFHKHIWHTNDFGSPTVDVIAGSKHIRNLSHDLDEAIRIAKAYMEEHKYTAPLHTDPVAVASNDRADVTSVTAYETKLSNQIFLSGKHIGKHVSEVPMDYICWAILNLHSPKAHIDQKRRNTTIINGQICYNYATEQGLLSEWLTKGEALLNDSSEMDKINEIINGDVFKIGKYRDESLVDFGYTKKKQLRIAVADYLRYMANAQIFIDKIIQKNQYQYIEHDDGHEEAIITTDMLKEEGRTSGDILSDNYVLTVLVCRHLCYKLGLGKPFSHTTYTFKSKAMEYSDSEKLRRFYPEFRKTLETA